MQAGSATSIPVFNRATLATRQPGSSFKPFVYAAALDSGFSPSTIVIDAPIEVQTRAGPVDAEERLGQVLRSHAAAHRGRAVAQDLMTVRIAQEIGMETVAGLCRDASASTTGWASFLANCAGIARRPRCSRWSRPMPCSPMAASACEPTLVDRVQDRFGTHDLPPRPAQVRGLHASRCCPMGSSPRIASQRDAGDGPGHRLPADLDDARG
ncbi:MAG: penicillin-binding transpeptidase domain-containing protein [Rhodopseudomonas palustris]|nr:penicillin-binding transpeptidase domain-containing protein [Rhodopseudomonas palustris]